MQAARVSKEVYSSKFDSEAQNILLRRAVNQPICEQETTVEETTKEMAGLRDQALRDLQVDTDIREIVEHGKQLRGKSAKAIEYQLKTNALLNLSKSEDLADIRKLQRDTVHVLHDEVEHAVMMKERNRNLIELERITEPLVTLSQEMRSFEKRNSSYFLDKRCAGCKCKLDNVVCSIEVVRRVCVCVYFFCVKIALSFYPKFHFLYNIHKVFHMNCEIKFLFFSCLTKYLRSKVIISNFLILQNNALRFWII